MHLAFLIHICWIVIYPVNGIIQCLSIRGPVSLWKLKEYQCLHCEGNSPFVTYFLMILWISVEHAFPFPFRSLIGLSQWRIKYNIFCHHPSYCNIINNQDELQKPAKNQNLPSVEEIQVLYSHFQSCVPSACPELHCKKKLSLLYIHAYACISPFLTFHFFLYHFVTCNLNYCFILKSS